MNIFLYALLVILSIALAIPAIKFIKANGIPWFRKTIPESSFRVLVALRRRSAGIGQIIGMPLDSHAQIRNQVTQQWQALWQEWAKIGAIRGGFRKSEQGLPAGGDEDWFLIAFLDIPGYQEFRSCISVLDDPQFRDLRNYCDVRLILGDMIGPEGSNIKDFF